MVLAMVASRGSVVAMVVVRSDDGSYRGCGSHSSGTMVTSHVTLAGKSF